MNSYDLKNLEDFLRAIEGNQGGYGYATFSYVALREGDDFHLAQGRLQLQGVPSQIPSGTFQSENVRAGICLLSDLRIGTRDLIEQLFSGSLSTPQGKVHFVPDQGRSYSSYFSSHHQDGVADQCREVHLGITCDRRFSNDLTRVDWELKSGSYAILQSSRAM